MSHSPQSSLYSTPDSFLEAPQAKTTNVVIPATQLFANLFGSTPSPITLNTTPTYPRTTKPRGRESGGFYILLDLIGHYQVIF